MIFMIFLRQTPSHILIVMVASFSVRQQFTESRQIRPQKRSWSALNGRGCKTKGRCHAIA